MRVDACARVCLSLCVCALFVNPRHRGTSNSLISAEALCMYVRRCGFAFVSFSLSLGTAISVILAALWCFLCSHACACVLVRVCACACACVCVCACVLQLLIIGIPLSNCRFHPHEWVRALASTCGCARACVCVCMKRVAECSPIHSDIISDQKQATNGQTDGRTDLPSVTQREPLM